MFRLIHPSRNSLHFTLANALSEGVASHRISLEAAHKAPDIVGLLIDLDSYPSPSRLSILTAKC